MDEKQYRLEDALSTIQSTLHTIERMAMNAALRGGIGNDTRRQMLAHIESAKGAVAKLPEYEK